MSQGKKQFPAQSDEPHKYGSSAHTKHRLRYHLVFIPKSKNTKYRKRVLQGKVAARLEQLLRQACEVNRWSLEELAIQPDHVHFYPVHLLVQVQPKYSVSNVMRIFKGGSSRVLRSEFPALAEFLWGKSLWADGYFAATGGVVEGSGVSEDIRASSYDAEKVGNPFPI